VFAFVTLVSADVFAGCGTVLEPTFDWVDLPVVVESVLGAFVLVGAGIAGVGLVASISPAGRFN
jgi:hypothetical protein